MWYKEFFKFLAGAAAWDGIVAVWYLLAKLYPVDFFGITFNQFWLGIVFFIDASLVIVLSYLAWFYNPRKNASSHRKRKVSKR